MFLSDSSASGLRRTRILSRAARLDHFRGFEAFWEVPANALTALGGKWVKGPGAEFFRTLKTELKELPFVAENLGAITPAVEGLR
jgi:4-alpha-glucanotransferase